MGDGPGKAWMEGRESWTAEENEIAYLKERLRILERENSELRARIGRLESTLREGLEEAESDGDCIEYNDMVVGILREFPAQSLAAIKADALREAVRKCTESDPDRGEWLDPDDLLEEADRIEREAKENENE